jgi:WD40 repeat protein
VDRDKQLLATARDYFYFVTRFFEVIKFSAPHIYHSALELSPQSAIVRVLYYHCRPHPTPRVVRGVSSSWKQPLTIKTNHEFSTWSPCSKSLAVATLNNVEIWDILTLERRSTLQPAKLSYKPQDIHGQDLPEWLPDGIAYSPDGHSLACYSSSSTAIIIWDIQTGGVVNKIGCGTIGTTFKSLVWAFNGKTLGAIFAGGQGWVVHVYDVALGTVVSPGTLKSAYKPYLWSHEESLLILVLAISDHKSIEFDIYEVGPTLLRIKSFSTMLPTHNSPQTMSFSPTTGRISIVINKQRLCIFSSLDSEILLEEEGSFHGNCFSPNGSFLAASVKDCVYVWQYRSASSTTPNQYTMWGKIPFQSGLGDLPQGFQFSPTSLSLLVSKEGFLEVVHMDDIEANPNSNPPSQHGKISTNGTYIVTARHGGSIVAITNLYSQTPSWLIDVNLGIHGLALTGNILLVEDLREIFAWKLTAEGAVEGILGGKPANKSHSIWSCERLRCGTAESLVTGDTGIIQFHDNHLVYYNIDTGERYKSTPIQVPTPSTSHHILADLGFHTHLHHHSFHEHHNPPKDNQLASIPSYEGGWVKYPEGEHPHRFWLPAHWMADRGNNAYWLNDITTLWLHGNEFVVIKF